MSDTRGGNGQPRRCPSPLRGKRHQQTRNWCPPRGRRARSTPGNGREGRATPGERGRTQRTLYWLSRGKSEERVLRRPSQPVFRGKKTGKPSKSIHIELYLSDNGFFEYYCSYIILLPKYTHDGTNRDRVDVLPSAAHAVLLEGLNLARGAPNAVGPHPRNWVLSGLPSHPLPFLPLPLACSGFVAPRQWWSIASRQCG